MRWARRATGSAAAIFDQEARILLVRRAHPPRHWVLPGGNAEDHESPADTAIREIAEETGLMVVPDHLIGVYYQADHGAGEFLHFLFRCSPPTHQALRLEPNEVADAGWFERDALPEPMSESTRRRVKDAWSGEMPRLPVVLPRGADA